MTKQEALALMSALEGQQMPASAVLQFPTGGGESWSVELDPSHVYTGVQLGEFANYCSQQGLTLTATFSQIGVT